MKSSNIEYPFNVLEISNGESLTKFTCSGKVTIEVDGKSDVDNPAIIFISGLVKENGELIILSTTVQVPNSE